MHSRPLGFPPQGGPRRGGTGRNFSIRSQNEKKEQSPSTLDWTQRGARASRRPARPRPRRGCFWRRTTHRHRAPPHVTRAARRATAQPAAVPRSQLGARTAHDQCQSRRLPSRPRRPIPRRASSSSAATMRLLMSRRPRAPRGARAQASRPSRPSRRGELTRGSCRCVGSLNARMRCPGRQRLRAGHLFGTSCCCERPGDGPRRDARRIWLAEV